MPGRRTLTRVAIVALALFVAVRMFGRTELVESRVFYHPDRSPFPNDPRAQDVTFTTPDGLELHGWLFATTDRPAPAIVHVHGNAGNISSHASDSAWLASRGYHVFVFDYRGYGRSDDAPLARDALAIDARAAIDLVASRDDVTRCGLLCVSLGGAIGLDAMTDRENIACAVSIAAFATWKGVASDHASFLGRWLIPAGLDTRDAASKLDRPVLVVHGTADRVVPIHHGRTLQGCLSNGEFLEVADGGHNDLMGRADVRDRVLAFYDANLRSAPTH